VNFHIVPSFYGAGRRTSNYITGLNSAMENVSIAKLMTKYSKRVFPDKKRNIGGLER